MIRLTEDQYAAIGRMAVQSGVLERELGEYMVRLGKSFTPRTTLGPKIDAAERALTSDPAMKSAAVADFRATFSAIRALIDKRNALVHGIWSTGTNVPLSIEETTARGRNAAVRAVEVAALAEQLRYARKLLLRLCHDHCQAAAGNKKCPRASARSLLAQMNRAAP